MNHEAYPTGRIHGTDMFTDPWMVDFYGILWGSTYARQYNKILFSCISHLSRWKVHLTLDACPETCHNPVDRQLFFSEAAGLFFRSGWWWIYVIYIDTNCPGKNRKWRIKTNLMIDWLWWTLINLAKPIDEPWLTLLSQCQLSFILIQPMFAKNKVRGHLSLWNWSKWKNLFVAASEIWQMPHPVCQSPPGTICFVGNPDPHR